jgi:hypothetical protein
MQMPSLMKVLPHCEPFSKALTKYCIGTLDNADHKCWAKLLKTLRIS